MNQIKMNKSFAEFSKLPKIKQVFTPWFIAALVIFIVGLTIAFAMVGLLNEGFENARALVNDQGQIIGKVADVSGDNHSLMSWLGYDQHANYQELYKTIHDQLINGKTMESLINNTNKNNDPKLYEALHYHAHSKFINHNGTWGFVTKVLSDWENSWFYKYNQLFSQLANSQNPVLAAQGIKSLAKLSTIIQYQNPNYIAYNWVFIVFMMPQMITFIIIVVKLATVFSPKKSAEEKQAYKLAKLEVKNQKKAKKLNNSLQQINLNLEAN